MWQIGLETFGCEEMSASLLFPGLALDYIPFQI
jgi:hypothetical protein